MKRLIIEFDENEIDELMAIEAVKGFELPFVENVYVEDGLSDQTCEVLFDVARGEGLFFKLTNEQAKEMKAFFKEEMGVQQIFFPEYEDE